MNDPELRDARRPGWCWLDNAVIDDYAPRIGAHGLAVYLVLVRFADRDGNCFPAHQKIMDLLGLSRNTVKKALDALTDAGLLRVAARRGDDGSQTSHLYTLLHVGQVSPRDTPPCQTVTPPLSNGDTEQDLINKTHFNKCESDAGASLLPPPGPPKPDKPRARSASKAAQERDPALDHPAVILYRELVHRTPGALPRAEIAKSVTDNARWQATITAWLLAGYRPDNVAGMLDWYTSGIPQRQKGGSNGKTASSRPTGIAALRSAADDEYDAANTPEALARAQREWDERAAERKRRAAGVS